MINDILSSPYMGNVIGLISLGIGIIGLVLTIVTYLAAKRIENRLNKEKANAINKMHFNEYKANAIRTLKNRQSAVKNAGKVTKQACNELVEICNKIKGYENTVSKEDLLRIDELYSKLLFLHKDKNYVKEDGLITYTEITMGLINILEKGEYEI